VRVEKGWKEEWREGRRNREKCKEEKKRKRGERIEGGRRKERRDGGESDGEGGNVGDEKSITKEKNWVRTLSAEKKKGKERRGGRGRKTVWPRKRGNTSGGRPLGGKGRRGPYRQIERPENPERPYRRRRFFEGGSQKICVEGREWAARKKRGCLKKKLEQPAIGEKENILKRGRPPEPDEAKNAKLRIRRKRPPSSQAVERRETVLRKCRRV